MYAHIAHVLLISNRFVNKHKTTTHEARKGGELIKGALASDSLSLNAGPATYSGMRPGEMCLVFRSFSFSVNGDNTTTL